MNLSQQIESPIVAIGNFIDNAVQAFHDQIVSSQKAKRGEPLKVDITITKWRPAKLIDAGDEMNGTEIGKEPE